MKSKLRKPLSLLLAVIFTLALMPTAFAEWSPPANMLAVAQGTDVFLSNQAESGPPEQRLQLGITKDGNFGSAGNAPAGFKASGAAGSRIGMYMSNDVTTDFFMPGTIDESFTVGVGGKKVATGSYGSNLGSSGISSSSTKIVKEAGDLSEASLSGSYNAAAVQALTTLTLANGLNIYQLATLENGNKFFHMEVSMSTTSGTMENVRYMRAFDPDHRSNTIGFATNNVVGHPELTGYGTSVFAYGANDQKTSPFFFFSNWNLDDKGKPGATVQAGYTTAGLCFTDIYNDGVMVFTPESSLYRDTDIIIRFSLGTVGTEPVVFDWYASMDSNVTSAIENILKATAVSDVKVDMDDATMSITDTKSDYKYALVDETGKVITAGAPTGHASGWVTGTDGDTSFDWTGLDPSTKYRVVTMGALDGEDVTGTEHDTAASDKSIIVTTEAGKMYALYKAGAESDDWVIQTPASVTAYGGTKTNEGNWYTASHDGTRLEFTFPDDGDTYKVVECETSPSGDGTAAAAVKKLYVADIESLQYALYVEDGDVLTNPTSAVDGSTSDLTLANANWYTSEDGSVCFTVPDIGVKYVMKSTTDSSAPDPEVTAVDLNNIFLSAAMEPGYEYKLYFQNSGGSWVPYPVDEMGDAAASLTKIAGGQEDTGINNWFSGDTYNNVEWTLTQTEDCAFAIMKRLTKWPDTLTDAEAGEAEAAPTVSDATGITVTAVEGMAYKLVTSSDGTAWTDADLSTDSIDVLGGSGEALAPSFDNWFANPGETISFVPLTPAADKQYKVVAIPFGEKTLVSPPNKSTDDSGLDDVTGTDRGEDPSDEDKDRIVIATDPAYEYAIYTCDADGTPLMAASGWQSDDGSDSDEDGTDNQLTFPGLDPTLNYVVAAKKIVAVEPGVTVYPAFSSPALKPTLKIPSNALKLVTGSDGNPYLNILSPLEGVYYNVVKDPDTNVASTTEGVTAGTTATDYVKTTKDTLTYGPLEAGRYIVSAKSDDDDSAADVTKAVEVLAPPTVERGDITRAIDVGAPAKDAITVVTKTGVSYALCLDGTPISAPGGTTLAGDAKTSLWIAGNDGDELVFAGLDPTLKYSILAIDNTAPEGGEVKLPLTGEHPVPTIPVVIGGTLDPAAANATVKVAVVKEDGTATVLTTTTKADGSYQFNTAGVKHGTYTVFADSAIGDGSAPFTTRSGASADISLNDGATATMFGGAVTIAVPYYDNSAVWHVAGSPAADWNPAVNGGAGDYIMKVVDKATGETLTAGVDYTINGNTTAAGGYIIEGLAPGDYMVQANCGQVAANYANFAVSGMTEIHVANGKVTPANGYKTLSINLNYGHILNGNITGVTPLVDGEIVTVQLFVPVYGAVTPSSKIPAIIGTKLVTAVAGPAKDGNAFYSIAGVPAGTYVVTAYTADGREVSADDVTVSGAKTQDLVLQDKVTAKNTIVGAVLDSTGKGVKGAAVTVYNAAGEVVGGPVTSQEGGGYAVDGLSDGTYYVAATKTGLSGVTNAIEVKGGQVVTGLAENITMTAGNLVIGQVTDHGAAVPGAAVSAAAGTGGTVTTNNEGVYFLPGVAASADITAVSASGRAQTLASAEANPNTVNLAITNPSSGILVIGPDGKPLTDASVSTGTLAAGVITDSSGPITITKGGMTYTIESPADGSTVFIPAYTVSGVVRYAETNLFPVNATVTVSGNWGSGTVDIKNGKYSIPSVPAGTYNITMTALDPDGGAKIVVTKSGVEISGNTTLNLDIIATNVSPTNIADLRDAIDGDLSGKTLAELTEYLEKLRDLTSEQSKQIDVKHLAGKLMAAMDAQITASTLTKDAKVEGDSITGTVANSVENALKTMLNAQLDSDDVTAIVDPEKNIDVLLHMNVDNVQTETEDVAKALAFAPVTAVAAVWDISIEKITTVTNASDNTVDSVTNTPVHNLAYPVQLTLNIPVEGQGYEYYALITVHNGVAKRVPITVASDTRTLTFQSKDFSVFTLLYSHYPIYANDAPVDRGTSGNYYPAQSAGGKAIVDKCDGGSIVVTPKTFNKGSLVTITVKPDEGHELNGLFVTDEKGNVIKLTKIDEKTYTFSAPGGDVNISASFRKTQLSPEDTGVSKLLNTDDHVKYLFGDTKGKFNPNANMTRAEAAQMFFNILRDQNVTLSASFKDVNESAWYAKAVRALASLGIINGYTDGTFRPEKSITRAEFAAIAMRFANLTTGNAKFTDVASSHWAYANIQSAYAYGWITGYTDGSFRPGKAITRTEVATMVNKMLGRSPDKAYIDANAGTLKIFPDVAPGFWGFYTIVEASNTHNHTRDGSVETWTAK